MNERRGRVTAQGSKEFLDSLSLLDIRIESEEPSFDDRVLLPLARRHGLTAYDTIYLELAMRRRLPLATFDKDLLKAALLEGVRLAPLTNL